MSEVLTLYRNKYLENVRAFSMVAEEALQYYVDLVQILETKASKCPKYETVGPYLDKSCLTYNDTMIFTYGLSFTVCGHLSTPTSKW